MVERRDLSREWLGLAASGGDGGALDEMMDLGIVEVGETQRKIQRGRSEVAELN